MRTTHQITQTVVRGIFWTISAVVLFIAPTALASTITGPY